MKHMNNLWIKEIDRIEQTYLIDILLTKKNI